MSFEEVMWEMWGGDGILILTTWGIKKWVYRQEELDNRMFYPILFCAIVAIYFFGSLVTDYERAVGIFDLLKFIFAPIIFSGMCSRRIFFMLSKFNLTKKSNNSNVSLLVSCLVYSLMMTLFTYGIYK